MDRPILNIADVEYRQFGHGDRFDAQLGAIGSRVGARKLGYNVTVLPPGRCAFPFHNHRVNEEMFFVLEGEGEIRIGEDRHSIRSGDVIACPPGGPETAHQIANTSESAELRYLAVSTWLSPEVAEYPDSGKFGVFAESEPDADGTAQSMRFIGRVEAGLDYWEGE
jgi:uncharacterized cupin superfamily protein